MESYLEGRKKKRRKKKRGVEWSRVDKRRSPNSREKQQNGGRKTMDVLENEEKEECGNEMSGTRKEIEIQILNYKSRLHITIQYPMMNYKLIHYNEMWRKST